MSHITTLATSLVDKRLILQALDEMGLAYEEGDVQVKSFDGRDVTCEISIAVEDSEYAIGLRRNGAHYELSADWDMNGVDQDEFHDALTQRYAYCAVREQLGSGFEVVEEHRETDNTIHVLLRRMA